MKQRSQSERIWPARWNPFAVEPIRNRYRQSDKAPATGCCPACGAVYFKGRWLWRSPPPGATSLTCSACQRAIGQMLAARIHLSRDFKAAHREEIPTFTRYREADLRVNHPMERIMAIESTSSDTDILTAGFHLARDIGYVIHHAFHGHLAFNYGNTGTELHVKWSR